MIVIVVGPDKAGKSTLTEAVTRRMYPDVVYKGKPRSDQDIHEVMKHVMDLAHMKGIFVWCDRFHFPDDVIYREALDLPDQDDGLKLYMAMCGKILKERNAVFLFLDADDSDLVKRYHATNEDPYVSVEKLLKVAAIYRRTADKIEAAGFNVIRANTSVLPLETLHANIIQTLCDVQAEELKP